MQIKLLRTVHCDGKEFKGGSIVDESEMHIGHIQSVVGSGWAEVVPDKKTKDIQLDDPSDSESEKIVVDEVKPIQEPGADKPAPVKAKKPTAPKKAAPTKAAAKTKAARKR